MSDSLTRARMMAKIAAPLLTASLQGADIRQTDPESLAQRFSQDINRVVPIAQALVAALKPEDAREHDEINALAAPVAAQLIAQNPQLIAGDGDELARFLKPSLNVLASFCDRESDQEPLSNLQGALAHSMVALSPIVGCLSRYAFGKSPAKRLTDTLDILTRSQKDLLASLPASARRDPDLRAAIMTASASLFAAHFDVMLAAFEGQEIDDPDARFRELLSQWSQSLGLLSVLVQHAAGDTAAIAESGNVSPLRATKTDAGEGDDDEEGSSGGGSGGGSKVKPGAYNPMSFFAKKGGM